MKLLYRAGGAAVVFAGLGAVYLHFSGGRVTDPAQSSATIFQIPAGELEALKQVGKTGDCAAAYRLAHHFSFALNQRDDAIYWLRIAARCPNADAKAELVYMLLGPSDKGEIAQEIDQLVLELEKTSPGQAQEVKKEVALRRAGKP
ncbi:hypothetical protein ACG0Z3_21720 [Roseateles sp. LKC17W]|uniref:Sel1 repeat family protein n=2 Tax=Pelomonas margarita TaxID=3299031 RepID=A0ABW7FPT1_9BURK